MDPNPIGLLSLKEEIRTQATRRSRGDHVRAQREGTICKPRREALGETHLLLVP